MRPEALVGKGFSISCIRLLHPAAGPAGNRSATENRMTLARPRYRGVFSTLAVLLPSPAAAHVKWFTSTDVRDATLALPVVLSPVFLGVLGVFTALVLAGFVLDGLVARAVPAWIGSGTRFARTEERLVRGAAGGYFIYVAAYGTVLLTPELRDHAPWIAIVQFLIAVSLLWRPTCAIAAVGIVILYAASVAQYGVFHLTDYLFLLTLAFYLASLTFAGWRGAGWREPILVGGLAFSLAWTAIEKFLYPQWTIAVIALHPSIGMGLPPALVTVIAGFVEFTLAFYLVTGRGLLRLGGFGYLLIFAAAMPVFGRLDVFGHLVIIATLLIVMLRGVTPMQQAMHRRGAGVLAGAGWITVLYLLTLSGFFAAYYALQQT
jgi:hypothetical protein